MIIWWSPMGWGWKISPPCTIKKRKVGYRIRLLFIRKLFLSPPQLFLRKSSVNNTGHLPWYHPNMWRRDWSDLGNQDCSFEFVSVKNENDHESLEHYFRHLHLLFHPTKDWGVKTVDHVNVCLALPKKYSSLSLGQELEFALPDAHKHHTRRPMFNLYF